VGPRSQYGKFGEKRNIVPVPEIEMLFFGLQAQKPAKKNRKFLNYKNSITRMKVECPLRKV
jgi:hypothetical protein